MTVFRNEFTVLLRCTIQQITFFLPFRNGYVYIHTSSFSRSLLNKSIQHSLPFYDSHPFVVTNLVCSYSLLGWGICPLVPGVGVGARPVTTPGTLVTVKGVGDCPGDGVGKPKGPGVGAHCGTLQQVGSWGSTTSVQPAGTGSYTLHLQREHAHITALPAKGTSV